MVRQNRTNDKAVTRAVLLTKVPAIRIRREIMGIQLTQKTKACQDPSKRMEVFQQQEVTKRLALCKKTVGPKSFSKACSATGNTGVKQPSKAPNKTVKTGTALEAPVVVELLPQAWPWIVAGGKAFISALAGMGIVTLVGEISL